MEVVCESSASLRRHPYLPSSYPSVQHRAEILYKVAQRFHLYLLRLPIPDHQRPLRWSPNRAAPSDGHQRSSPEYGEQGLSYTFLLFRCRPEKDNLGAFARLAKNFQSGVCGFRALVHHIQAIMAWCWKVCVKAVSIVSNTHFHLLCRI